MGFTCFDTFAPSNRSTASNGAGKVSCAKYTKSRKYARLASAYSFAQICIESMGGWGDGAKNVIHRIGGRVRNKKVDPRAISFHIQRLVIDVQRENLASALATLPTTKDWEEFSRLPPF